MQKYGNTLATKIHPSQKAYSESTTLTSSPSLGWYKSNLTNVEKQFEFMSISFYVHVISICSVWGHVSEKGNFGFVKHFFSCSKICLLYLSVVFAENKTSHSATLGVLAPVRIFNIPFLFHVLEVSYPAQRTD